MAMVEGRKAVGGSGRIGFMCLYRAAKNIEGLPCRLAKVLSEAASDNRPQVEVL